MENTISEVYRSGLFRFLMDALFLRLPRTLLL